MAIINEIKREVTGGADLLKPKVSLSWIIGAVFAVVVLLIAYAGGKFLFGKLSGTISNVAPGTGLSDAESDALIGL